MSDRQVNVSELYPVYASTFKLGMELKATLFDEEGRLLLAKHHVIDSPQLLKALQERPALYTDELSNRENTKAVMSTFEAATRQDAPLKELDRLIERRPEPPELTAGPVQATFSQQWTDLEAGLRATLANLVLGGQAAHDALRRLEQQVQRLQALMRRDREASLFLLFNRSVTSFANYSTLHSLLCAAVAWDAAQRLPISASETDSLLRAALTMNVAVRSLQDQMAVQRTKPSQEQLLAIDRHGHESRQLLSQAGVSDARWLAVVARHHEDLPPCAAINDRPSEDKLIKVLQVIDRYTAVMSPRGTRGGREPKEAVKAVIRSPGVAEHDEVGLDLMQHLGLYPPGTYVKLARGDTAVVLRHGRRPQTPTVATVLNRQGEPVLEHRLNDTMQPECTVADGVAGSSIRVRLNEDLLLRHLAASRASVLPL